MSFTDESNVSLSDESWILMDPINDSVRKKLELLNDKMKNSSQIVSNHCLFLRDCIDIRTESLICRINQLNALFMTQVDEFETKTLTNMKENCQFQNDIESFINETNELVNSFELEPARAAQLKALIDEKNEEIDKYLFNQHKLVFKEYDHDILSFQFGELHEFKEDNEIEVLNIRKMFNLNYLYFDAVENLHVNISSKNFFVFAFRYKKQVDPEQSIHLILTNFDLRILHQTKVEQNLLTHKVTDFKLITYKNKIVLQLILNDSNNTLLVYVGNLLYRGSLKSRHHFEDIQCTNKMIVCRYETLYGSFYSSYDWINLKEASNIIFAKIPPLKRCVKMLIANGKYHFRFRLRSETCFYSYDGKLLESTSLIPYDPFTKYLIDSKERIICLNRKGLFAYNKDGELICEKQFDDLMFSSSKFRNANIFLGKNDVLYLYSFHDEQFNLYRLNKFF
jgi:hypothetical protein